MRRGVVQVSADDTSVVVLQRGLIQQFTGSYLCVFGYGGFILSFWTTSGRCAHHALELCPRRRSPPPSPSPTACTVDLARISLPALVLSHETLHLFYLHSSPLLRPDPQTSLSPTQFSFVCCNRHFRHVLTNSTQPVAVAVECGECENSPLISVRLVASSTHFLTVSCVYSSLIFSTVARTTTFSIRSLFSPFSLYP